VRSALVAEVLRRQSRLRVRLRVYGESMLPALWPGDVVEIESCALEELRPGEIVLALRDEGLVLHRLVADRRPKGFVLRGDCILRPDPEYPADALLGRLVRGVRGPQDIPQSARWARLAAEWVSAKWSRAIGMFFYYCDSARRGALKVNSRRKASDRDLTVRKHHDELVTLGLNSSEIGSSKAGTC
jgi:hypothetical protein